MEKRHKPSYHSDKILGQLYDKVESVDFVPQWEEPFDKRILRAYKLDDAILKSARQVKSEYDTAMRRIMAQQEINTEFEVWSTFVLSRPRVGSDYKVQETMGVITDGLKEQFRLTCIEKAGSKDFSALGPFVAAMYKVTKEELDIALAECRTTITRGGREVPKRKMEQKSMPLISFPWLFEKELGRIATGMEAEDDLAGLGLLPLVLKSGQARKRQSGGDENADDYIQQEDGVIVHRGEELDLFRPDVDSDDLSGESDFEEARSVREGGSYVLGESGEVVLNTIFQTKPTPAYLLSGTGVEDVVPRTELDGFIDPRETARFAHDLQSQLRGLYNANSVGPLSDRRRSADLFPFLGAVATPKTSVPEKSGPEAEEELFEDSEEEEIQLDVEESSLEKLARMMDS
jgi:RNA-dependent RNA polymerase